MPHLQFRFRKADAPICRDHRRNSVVRLDSLDESVVVGVMSSFDPLSSRAFRERAEEARVIAHTFKDAETRNQMLRIAAGYDRMAELMERQESSPPPSSDKAPPSSDNAPPSSGK